jgi:REP element-mobilizing transposase RayT
LRRAARSCPAGPAKPGRPWGYSVQANHLHLIVEAEDEQALARGMKGLKVRLARKINALVGRKGTVFADRYHARILSSPRAVKNALAYCLNNARKHALQRKKRLPARWVDPFSTAKRFYEEAKGLVSARTWLLRVGWRRWGEISPSLVPGSG